MRFSAPLVPAILIRRYKRFLADVMLDGETVTVHVANPGAMTGLAAPGARVLLSRSHDRARKMPFRWEIVEVDLGSGAELVGVDTIRANRLAGEALGRRLIPELDGYASVRREVRCGRTCRIDYLLESPERAACWLEVKNVHLMRQAELAEFPDSVTLRGARHLDELARMAAAGFRSVMLFVIQIGSATRFAPARDIDARYAAAFDRARAQGVEFLAWRCAVSPTGIELDRAVPVVT